MPRLSAEVVTTTEVELSPKLTKQLKAKLTEMRKLRRAKKNIDARLEGGKVVDDEGNVEEVTGLKAEIETLFADADEYAALDAGVRINTPFGEVPVKMVRPEPGKGSLSEKKMLIKFYVKKGSKFIAVTQADIDSCRNAPSNKKPYLGVYLPKEGSEGDEE